ncbi:cholesterol transporter ABCA5, partial [Hyalella azteca]|uniref:Cholesterol transporter ABCA5 n=1 Tax=Hyalella azteca TaxID=294128 RepID=A0A8B7PQW8_HYAAZ
MSPQMDNKTRVNNKVQDIELEQPYGHAAAAAMEGTLWQQYMALLRRNFLIKIRERRKTISEFALPLYFLLILALLRLAIPAPSYPAQLNPHDYGNVWGSAVHLCNVTLHSTPNTTQVRRVVDAVARAVRGRSVYYEKEEDIVDVYRNHSPSVEVALVFSEEPLRDRNYTIRMNPVLRPLPDPSNLWVSPTMCRQTVNGSLESPITCPPTYYYYSGLLGLQGLVDWAILRDETLVDDFNVAPQRTTTWTPQHSGPLSATGPHPTELDNLPCISLPNYNLFNTSLPNISYQSFPLDAVVSSNLEVLRDIVPLYMVFSWAQFIVYMLMLIVEEKEKKIKEGMKMMGLQGVVYWLSWLTVYGLYVVVLALLCTIILPLANIFLYASPGYCFLLFILYGLSSIILALMMTPFFSKAKVAGVVGNLTQVFMSLLFYLQVYLGDQIDPVYYWLLALMSPCAFSFAIDKILVLDVTAGGLSSSTLWTGPGLPFAGSLIMISLDIVLYLVLALYLDAVVPTEYGTRLKPWFFLQPSFWRRPNRTSTNELYAQDQLDDDNLMSSERRMSAGSVGSSGDVEEVGPEMRGKAGVIIRGVCKTFKGGRGKPPIKAVDNFSLTIYEDEITAILGHNGAGKTTLFNVLTGMTEVTSGAAHVFGLSVGDPHDLREIRSMTGVCPQHDILFTVLTPREHLMFYARIRGLPEARLREEVERALDEVDLSSKADSKADDLSGGQKRKLSIAMALMGDPRLVFLDEPTAGVDAYSRRRLWGLLKRRKRGKVI